MARAGVAPRRVDGFERPAERKVATLQRGMTGPLVTALQQRLVSARFMTLADMRSGPGVFGPRTEAAVKRLQAAAGLPVTGVAGPTTQAALQGTKFQGRPARVVSAVEVTAPIAVRLPSQTFTDDVTQPIRVPI